ncbi:penicillin-binding protein 2 [bacterium (Candidatus Blackallbacteria) CG17_big_fil_post_rev_8_21_14_2_50_48_46]|uniref:Penicillin-binding protein 2 n=1 Tax=bacterium (Candidatus Blackallbacteria) CG17_big_fil_post_rev_8_21_14_2_50_48_46 TaxID=2014261 RepID=A0A2M7GB73_9BACT|nr:MAG: penicillin-binding protein 2 [bacterium (Candidatus Blackallbacteria) CG18_big_fil_WC_8_21_14_2_50_49_26]PIW19417.1 MAG: penicillin-binding protein 2 [bacterium (Candidatus Blackallbacteria) CG17_big_fil_post_rev_8_21_14_2_50_48_46]PIW48979.1 MAG: penicillin-binding protein 2 [bacterium (Candidatus Blackallbacteria) CG13_big_fil_rev_8_21_14_2_50_49_14]
MSNFDSGASLYDFDYYKARTHRRILWIFAAVILIGFLLLFRLFSLQIVQHEELSARAEKNRMRSMPLLAPRGMVYDRQSKILATNKLSHSLLFHPGRLSTQQAYQTLQRLSHYLELPYSELLARVRFDSEEQIYLAHNLNSKALAMISENQSRLPGVEVVTELERFYPENELASHILGYMGQITAEELKLPRYKDYRPGALVGKSGFERLYERYLKGKDGQSLYSLNINKNQNKQTETIPPQAGHSLKLTLDKSLQQYCMQLLQARKAPGAIVVMEPDTGAVLAMVSNPSYNLNLFTEGLTQEEWKTLQNTRYFPFLDRTLNPYPPGSIFKMITTLAALQEGYLTPEQTFYSRGSLNVGGHIFYDWNRTGFGIVNIYKALAHSIDTVFYELALKMGIEPIRDHARLFELDQPTGIELQGEHPGLIPDKAWKKKVYHSDWLPGDSVNASIGQGFVQMTPLQATRMVATIANGGKMPRPYLLQEILDNTGKSIYTAEPEKHQRWISGIEPRHWEVVRRGMEGAVSYGTAKAMKLKHFGVAGKTGTAETIPGKPTHAWIVAYAPTDHPRYAMTVFLEHGGSGGGKAAPLAKQILNYLLERPLAKVEKEKQP